jgi:flagellar motility protein MotE (MotC chaperone)
MKVWQQRRRSKATLSIKVLVQWRSVFHSERRDRNFRNRIHNTYGKSFALSDKASYYEGKAASVGSGGISSDDPEAIQKLKIELAGCEALQTKMKKTNACIKKNDREGLKALGFSDHGIDGLFKPDFCKRIGFAAYQLSNNNANIRRIKVRIKDLETRAKLEDKEEEGKGYIYREDTAENRVMFIFEGKPDQAIRNILKKNAFKWSPSREAWVRQLNNAGIYAAQQIRKTLDQTA